MNLHSIVSPIIGAINPTIVATVRVSVGNSKAADFSRQPAYATPGAFMGSIDGTTLTVETVGSGVLQPGQTLSDENGTLLPGTMVTAGDPSGGPGSYQVSRAQQVALELMQTSLAVPAQVQPLTYKDLAQLEGINQGGRKAAIYVNGDLNGVVRFSLKGGDLVTLPDGTTWLVVQQLEGFNLTSGWTKCAMALQNGG